MGMCCDFSRARATQSWLTYAGRAGRRTQFDAGIWIDRRRHPGASVLINMESVSNYPSLNVSRAHADGYDVVMTTSLDSDVPSTYFSWTGAHGPPILFMQMIVNEL
jgi:hypothetical protein